MFCPKCATENLDEQKFCRKCGHQLSGHRAAMEGSFEEALARLNRGATAIKVGLVALLFVVLNALLPLLSNLSAEVIVINVMVVLAFSATMLSIGLANLRKAQQALRSNASARKEIAQPIAKELPSAPDTDRSISVSQSASVTEETTRKLE